MEVQVRVFTTKYNGLVNVLRTQVHIGPILDPNSAPKPLNPSNCSAKEFTAIWDTGATNSVITQNVINQCGLKPTGVARVFTAKGEHLTETFLVSLFLPNGVVINQLKVSRGELVDGSDVLIGMDIMSQGDFSVTNFHGRTTLSFRMPSIAEVDYVTQRPPGSHSSPLLTSRTSTGQKVGRNDPCPCGSGKKYKKCCGKAS